MKIMTWTSWNTEGGVGKGMREGERGDDMNELKMMKIKTWTLLDTASNTGGNTEGRLLLLEFIDESFPNIK